ncbi:MAG TPA: acyl-CoA thioesterase [Elusimicrobiota bacterium]|jgi:acyl-CoA thioester hydrolase|nr:acyl-CoA thioesterase [Elusimicrobiota bacterium]
MPAVFEHRRQVADREIDELGHANNQAYLTWMLEAANAHSAAQGWPAEKYFALGSCWVVRRHEIEYLVSAKPKDEIVVKTWVSTLERISSERRYEILRAADGKLLARASTLWAWIDMKTGRPARVPPEVSSAYEVVAPAAPQP